MKLNLTKGLEALLVYIGVACGRFYERYDYREPTKIAANSKTLDEWGAGNLTSIGKLEVVRDENLKTDEIEVL